MAVYYINGTSSSGSTFGQSGYYYPLYLTESEANSADLAVGGTGTSHSHTFEEAPNITFYMATSGATHAAVNPPNPSNFNNENYISYTSPIAEADVEEIGTGVLAGDTFNSWRKKTNDVARESISNKATIGSVDSRLTRLLSVTGGENNIMSLTSSDNITGEKEFEGIVKLSGAINQSTAIQIGANGKLYVEGSKFLFDKDIDLHTAGAEIKASSLNIPAGGTTNYSGVEYTWPTTAPSPGEFLKSNANNNLEWSAVTAGDLASQVQAFFIEDPFPIGSIMPYARATEPTGYEFCRGQSLNTFEFKELHAAISNTYGGTAFNAGTTDQSGATTTFNVPDLRARVPVGLGTNADANGISAKFNALGDSTYIEDPDGSSPTAQNGEYKTTTSASQTLTIDQVPAHRHVSPFGENNGIIGVRGVSDLRWGHFATSTQGAGSYGGMDSDNTMYGYTRYTGGAGSTDAYSKVGTNDLTFDAPNPITFTSTDNSVQPFVVLNYIIKALPSLIVEQHVEAGDGILINDSNTTTNLLRATSDSGVKGSAADPNTFSLNADSDDFEFDSGKLKLKAKPFRAGETIQVKLDSVTQEITTTNTIPDDNTIPLITEGADTGLKITMTPTSTSSIIKATIQGQFRNQAEQKAIQVVLFEDNTAVGAMTFTQPRSGQSIGGINFYFNSASTTEHDYTVRFGSSSSSHTTRLDLNTTLGGLNKATLFLEEIAQ